MTPLDVVAQLEGEALVDADPGEQALAAEMQAQHEGEVPVDADLEEQALAAEMQAHAVQAEVQ